MNDISGTCRKLLGRALAASCTLLLLPLVFSARGRTALRAIGEVAAGRRCWIGGHTGDRAGLVSTARLHALLGLPDAGEAEQDALDLRQRGWLFDAALLLRYLWARLLGGARQTGYEARWPLLGLWLDNLDHGEILRQLADWAQQAGQRRIAFVNPHCANLATHHARYRSILNRADLLLPDGSGVLLAGRLLGTPMKANSNGTDLFPVLCRHWQQQGARLYLLGGQEGVADAVAARLLLEYPGIHVAGCRDGYFKDVDTPHVVTEIRKAAPDVLLVAMGAPLQDLWLAEHADALGVPLVIGVGGLFDFYSGRISRAPLWLRELGLEWCWRLAMEPARMWRRYLLGNAAFLLRVIAQRCQNSPAIHVQPVRGSGDKADAILLASRPLWQGAGDDPAALSLPLAGLSLIERSVMALVRQGVQHIHVLADLGYVELQELLGNGERWGIRLSWHHCGSGQALNQRLASLPLTDRAWLLAPGCLPEAPLVEEEGSWLLPDGSWSGWARVSAWQLQQVKGCLSRLPQAPSTFEGIVVRNPGELLRAQADLLARGQDFPPEYREIAHQVWIAPDVLLEPGVTLKGPALIGAGALIRRGSSIGPNVVLGAGCVLERNVRCDNALLENDSYVAEGITVQDMLQLHGQIHAVRMGCVASLQSSDCLVGTLHRAKSRVSWRDRLQALLLIMLMRAEDDSTQHDIPKRSHLREVWTGRRHLIGLPELPSRDGVSGKRTLRNGALRLSALRLADRALPLVSDAEQAWLTDLYGSAVPCNLAWRQVIRLSSYFKKASSSGQ
ncbi:WecB/TagA/CpsF family glycosyltransferase [Chitinilyticum piscinae]|uniref:WecB/TagA/CpsF family glycosyltransferase n=1 Tax=Chitinilyticum piscinae TaxID=2866724 RepID=A0A8J7FKA6_9NEIS|nr:WecB/TagA/CpsF family glycosyltransferase [Chitinilyticum piscinae]MBE9609542.1 WecB/TagA/CpsF family glycosyltransferase [Chitinilyticum piscinae]